jgi:glycosyltransferase involved in cell wall biosynthesis
MMGIVIYPPTIDWSYMRQRPQQLMLMFARHGFPVLYFNKYNYPGPVVQKIENNLYVINHMEFFMKQIYPRLASSQSLYWSTWSRKIPQAKRFQAKFTVYDCVDDFPDWENDEKAWVNEADAIVCTADSLKSKMEQLVPHKPIEIVRNGCDWPHFAKINSIKSNNLYDLPVTTGPKIGYIGAWAPWVDEELIRYTAQALPDAQLLIVGPQLRVDPGFLGPNVINLGYKDYAELPSILSYLDLCIIPFRINRITESTNPIKAYEYMAAGRPVVSTDLPEVRKLDPYVLAAQSYEQFVELIQQSMDTTVSQRQIISQYARRFSWDQRFAQIYAMIAELFPDFLHDHVPLELLEQATLYQCMHLPMMHCTVNSYYKGKNLIKDPAMVGHLPAGIYECYIQLQAPALFEQQHRLFLEFEPTVGNSQTVDYDIIVSAVDEPWNRHQLTFERKPAGQKIIRWNRSEALNDSFSVEITFCLQAGRLPSFRISTDANHIIGIRNPRIAMISDTD